MKKLTHIICLISLCLATFSCGNSDQSPEEVQGKPVITKTALRLYPEATSVVLYVSAKPKTDSSGNFIIGQTKGIQLTPEQRKRFEASFYQAHLVSGPDQQEASACFFPHHFFKYYDASGQQVGQVAICFCCLGASMNPVAGKFTATDWVDQDWEALRSLMTSMKVPTDFECR